MSARHSPNRVLIVEGELLVGFAVEALLSDHGYDVVGCVFPEDVRDTTLSETRPDLAIVDIGPDSRGGLDTARDLLRRGLPFLFYSGANREALCLDEELAGIPWVAKPTVCDELLDALELVRRAGRSTASSHAQGLRDI